MLSPQEFHTRRHRLRGGRLPDVNDCLKCLMAQKRCSGKLEYKFRSEADKKALEVNIERNWWPDALLKVYRCRWGAHWHLTTARRKVDLERVERTRKRWLRKTGRKDEC